MTVTIQWTDVVHGFGIKVGRAEVESLVCPPCFVEVEEEFQLENLVCPRCNRRFEVI